MCSFRLSCQANETLASLREVCADFAEMSWIQRVRVYGRIRKEANHAIKFHRAVKVRNCLFYEPCPDAKILFQRASRTGYHDDIRDFYSEPEQPPAVPLELVSDPPQPAAVSAEQVAEARRYGLQVWHNMTFLNPLYRWSRTYDQFMRAPQFQSLAPPTLSCTMFAIPPFGQIICHSRLVVFSVTFPSQQQCLLQYAFAERFC
jgi:hypothetical protein